MNIKTKIKNDMWRYNYVLPFVKKHQFDEKGKCQLLKHVLNAYRKIHLVKAESLERNIASDINALLKKIEIVIKADNQFVYFIDTFKTIAVPGNIISNFSLDYSKVINGSFSELVNKALGNDNYGRMAEQLSEGIAVLCNRVIKTIEISELPLTIKEKRISDFKRMLNSPADHFDEALQRILFFNQLLWQTRHRLNGLGRLDKMLAHLYEKDINDGIYTQENIADMLDDFLYQLSRYSKYKSDALEGDIGQIIVVGGLKHDQSYFYNDLTVLFLQAQAKLKCPDPKIVLRVSKHMPEKILKVAVQSLLSKTGSPLFSNDDVVIPPLKEFGIREKDAYEYCTSACWEPYIVGKSFDQNNIAVFDFYTVLDEILSSKEQKTSESFENLVNIYIINLQNAFKKFLDDIDKLKWAKDPLVSLFTDDCSNRRLDISEGGAIYNNYGITTVGLSNVVDSLFVLKHLVFETKEYSLYELNVARRNNYEGYQDIYRRIQNAKHYYGHDDIETIKLVNRITKSLSDVAGNYKNKLGGTVKFGLSSPAYNMLSKKTTADFSGRKSGMPYNTHISCMDSAYTEIVNFAGKLNYGNQRFNGNVVDFFVSPLFLEKNIDKFTLFLKSAIRSGFFQMQMNVMDSKTLIDAKKFPEKYAGLIVRVWGFSAYFNDLPNSYKDIMIERALKAEQII